MQAQIEFSQQSPFQNFLHQLFSEGYQAEIVQGVFIDYHPYWIQLWICYSKFGMTDGYPYGMPDGAWALEHWQYLSGMADSEWRPDEWKDFCRRCQRAEGAAPFLVKISIVPGADLTRARIVRSIADRQVEFFCTLEERPIARAAASVQGSTGMIADEAGTLGGFLRDRNTGSTYGLTCAHVAQNCGRPVTLNDVSGTKYANAGSVFDSNYATLNTRPGGPCDITIPFLPEHVDIALIEPDRIHTGMNSVSGIGVVDQIYNPSQFGSGSDVVMRGMSSGKHDYYVGAYCAIYRVLFNDGFYRCFDKMFQILSTSGRSPWLPQKMAVRPASGDSGAWILCANASGNYAYCGTLVAVDDFSGYACLADSVLNWAASKHNMVLDPV
ncbi:hypothetical protein AB4Y45_45910 [Paraburkholderia sp. EG287A]|uniref:hypothetical protein n=1 Tax=unclassified Paraburkholderia TaxID=2615204 RepID=UPI0034D18FED